MKIKRAGKFRFSAHFSKDYWEDATCLGNLLGTPCVNKTCIPDTLQIEEVVTWLANCHVLISGVLFTIPSICSSSAGIVDSDRSLSPAECSKVP